MSRDLHISHVIFFSNYQLVTKFRVIFFSNYQLVTKFRVTIRLNFLGHGNSLELTLQPRPQGAFPWLLRWGAVTVIWASSRSRHHPSHIPKVLGIRGGGCPKR